MNKEKYKMTPKSQLGSLHHQIYNFRKLNSIFQFFILNYLSGNFTDKRQTGYTWHEFHYGPLMKAFTCLSKLSLQNLLFSKTSTSYWSTANKEEGIQLRVVTHSSVLPSVTPRVQVCLFSPVVCGAEEGHPGVEAPFVRGGGEVHGFRETGEEQL